MGNMNYIVLYNPLSNGGKGKEKAEEIKNYYNESKLEYQDITELENLSVISLKQMFSIIRQAPEMILSVIR